MSQVVSCVCEKTALHELQRDTSAFAELYDLSDMFDMSLSRLQKDHFFVKVHEGELLSEACQDDIHGLLKCF